MRTGLRPELEPATVGCMLRHPLEGRTAFTFDEWSSRCDEDGRRVLDVAAQLAGARQARGRRAYEALGLVEVEPWSGTTRRWAEEEPGITPGDLGRALLVEAPDVLLAPLRELAQPGLARARANLDAMRVEKAAPTTMLPRWYARRWRLASLAEPLSPKALASSLGFDLRIVESIVDPGEIDVALELLHATLGRDGLLEVRAATGDALPPLIAWLARAPELEDAARRRVDARVLLSSYVFCVSHADPLRDAEKLALLDEVPSAGGPTHAMHQWLFRRKPLSDDARAFVEMHAGSPDALASAWDFVARLA